MAQQREYTEIYKAWKQKADAFAFYYLVSFRPEINVYSIDHTNALAYDWEALCEWTCHLETQQVLIAKARFSALVQHVWILSTRNSHRNMMSAYRMRNRTVWSQREKDEAKDLSEKPNDRVRQATGNEHDLSDLLELAEDVMISSQHLADLKKEINYCQQQEAAFYLLFGLVPKTTHDDGSEENFTTTTKDNLPANIVPPIDV
jgi:hypothetical protein